MKEKFHFWYSKEQRKIRVTWGYGSKRPVFAMIKGEEVEYTECTKEKKPAGLWKDYKYLGKGTIYRVGEVIQ